MPALPFPLAFRAREAAAFISSQLDGSGAAGLEGRRIAVLGLLASRSAGEPLGGVRRPEPLDGMALCAHLLERGARLVVLDRPRNRLLMERLLQLAADGRGRVRGSCQLEADLAGAFRDAAAALLLNGWRQERPVAWGGLRDRMQPGAQLFDLRSGGGLERAAACGLQTWHLEGCTIFL